MEAVRKWKVGNPSDPTTDMGALISKDHLAKVNNVENIFKFTKLAVNMFYSSFEKVSQYMMIEIFLYLGNDF